MVLNWSLVSSDVNIQRITERVFPLYSDFALCLFQSEEATGAERCSEEEEEGGGRREEGEAEGGRGREVAIETPNAPVYCICRKPDINCFMM